MKPFSSLGWKSFKKLGIPACCSVFLPVLRGFLPELLVTEGEGDCWGFYCLVDCWGFYCLVDFEHHSYAMQPFSSPDLKSLKKLGVPATLYSSLSSGSFFLVREGEELTNRHYWDWEKEVSISHISSTCTLHPDSPSSQPAQISYKTQWPKKESVLGFWELQKATKHCQYSQCRLKETQPGPGRCAWGQRRPYST